MNPILSAGVLTGVLCGAWTFVMGWTGWFKDPVLRWLFFIVIPIEIAGLVWGLRRTAAEGRGYGGQIVAGTMMAVIAGVIIIGSSLLFTTVFFPEYMTELEATYRSSLEQQGKSAAEIAELLRAQMASQTPMNEAMSGFIGALVTGIVASAIIAIRVRSKPLARRTVP